MTLPAIGILGLGYLGRELLRIYPWPGKSWGTIHSVDSDFSVVESQNKTVVFDWENDSSWKNIPDRQTLLVLTIPPVCKEPAKERNRLEEWCGWMKNHRRKLADLVYISSTGVYPNQTGTWSEKSDFEPDTSKGILRRDTERILGRFFRLRVIRAGAIYGKNRNIGERISRREPIPKGNQPIHRIHVTDLAHIVERALTQPSFPSVVNAVDHDPAPSEKTANWLVNQDFAPFPPDTRIILKKDYHSRKHVQPSIDRKICNRRLLHECGYKMQYPSYKEGLRQIFNQ